MSRLSKEQKSRLVSIMSKHDLFAAFNKLLQEQGAGDLQLSSFIVQPVVKPKPKTSANPNPANLAIASNIAVNGSTDDDEEPDFSVFPPVCPHGIPMTQRCTVGGRCRWIKTHP